MNDMDRAIVELKKAMIKSGDLKADNNNSVTTSGRTYKGTFRDRSGMTDREFEMRKSTG